MSMGFGFSLPAYLGSGGAFSGAALLLDFTSGNQTLDPRITFTRASTATYFNSSGVLTTTGFNLLTYSEQFDNAAWTKGLSSVTANTVVAPDGTLTGDKLVEDTSNGQHHVRQLVSGLSSGSTLTLSIYLKAAERTTAQIYFNDNATTANRVQADFNLSAGTTSSATNFGTFTGATSSITSVGNGWYRCTVSGVATGVTSVGNRLIIGTTSYTGDGTSGIYMWGAQLETGSTATTYIPTVASTSGAARFDYNPTTLAPLGLLIEESRTNLLTYSEELDTGWTNGTAATWQVSSGVSPAGTTTALGVDGLSAITISTTGGSLYKTGITISGSTAYTFSVYVRTKTGTATNVRLRLSETGGNNTVSSDFTVTTSWTRISLSVTTASGATAITALVGTGTGTANLFIWGAQLEAGAFATSYIPTVASQVTRAADSAVMTGTNFSSWYNAAEGTLYAQADSVRPVSQSPSTRVFQFDDGTANNNIRSAAAAVLQVINATVVQANLTPSPAITFDGAVFDFASAYKLNDFAASTGGVVSTDTSGTVPSVNQFSLGGGSGAGILNGHIRRIAYFNRRLSNAELQGITA